MHLGAQVAVLALAAPLLSLILLPAVILLARLARRRCHGAAAAVCAGRQQLALLQGYGKDGM